MITDSDFKFLQSLALELAGIQLEETKKTILELKLSRRLRELGLSISDYCKRLRVDKDEQERFIEIITVGETYFFREMPQLEIFVEKILKKRSKLEKIRIWSAGCSTGPEPYTLAILLLENGYKNFEIWGTDINREALKLAQEAVYSQRAVSKVPPNLLKKYFIEEKGKWRVKDELKKYVNFKRVNLVNQREMMMMKNFDYIFCRNVLIYFPQDVRAKIARFFYFALKKGGYLFIGHSESLAKITTVFELESYSGIVIYKKV